jgi:ABC-2 type transport system ATP-binding protein
LIPAIGTQGLCRDFGSTKAVDGLTLEVASGAIFGFLGPNGAGKTTTIRLLLGLVEPTGGSASVVGFDVATQANEIRARSGVLLEHHGLYERLSAETNLEFYGRVFRLPAGERQARIKQLLTRMGLWERRREDVATWSRGMKHRLAVARAPLHRPSVLFLDEPTAGLDPLAARSLRDDLAALASQQGVTVFLTTHNLAEAEQLCDRVGVLREGRLIATGRPDALWGSEEGLALEVSGHGFSEELVMLLHSLPEVEEVRLDPGRLVLDLQREADVPALTRLIVESGAGVEEIRRSKRGLEESFLRLMEEESSAG